MVTALPSAPNASDATGGFAVGPTAVRKALLATGVVVLIGGCDLGSPPVLHPSPSRLVDVADVNGDGALDVVGVGRGAYQVLVNDGGGGLTGDPVVLDGDVVAFDLGDVDGDGVVDRVDVNRGVSGPETVMLSIGDGLGGFGVPQLVATAINAGHANDVALGDVEGDGDADLIVTRWSGVQIYSNDGTGTFTDRGGEVFPCIDHAYLLTITDVAFVDLDRDGDGDVVMTGWCEDKAENPGSELRVEYNRGDGVFTHASGSSTGIQGPLAGLSIADVDEDGRDDVVVAAPQISSVLVYRHGANGPFSYERRLTIPTAAGDVEVDDIDSDGNLDLVVTAPGTGSGRVLYGDGLGQFPESHVVATGGDLVGPVAVGSFDDDGSPDLVFGNDADSVDSSVTVLFNTRDGRQH